MMDKWYVGVDLGGTTIKMAFVSDNGEIIKKWEIPTDTSDQGKNITKQIAESIDFQLKELNEPKARVSGIGMGAPGFIDMSRGFIYHAVNIGWRDFPLKNTLEKETGLPVAVDNDANIAALGEMWRGAGEAARDLLCITLGTGVGGGIIVNGQIVHGKSGTAGEIGHITVIHKDGVPCNCGKSGCLETVASATGIVRLAKEGLIRYPHSSLGELQHKQGRLTAKDIIEAAEKQDELSLNVLETVGFYLGQAIAGLCNAFNPGKVIIGGGVSKAGKTLLDPVKKHFDTFALPLVAKDADFAIATLGNDAGVIGGAWIAKQQFN
ncbi:ROK family glucokinase [Fictibacillus sp. Mic-4]|uniref:ROK family glucokinase n=1 Tax=Fictibacillus sp. Mic-4 TaxID=3132826 RepID=UPI003CE85927